MNRRLATTTALGAALALAVSLSTAAAPADASTQRPGVIPSKPVIAAPAGPLPNPQPQTSTVTFKPDVRVNYLSKASASGGKVTYRFRVQNVGIGTASNVTLESRIYQLSNAGNVATMQYGPGSTIATLNQDQAKEVTVTCTPLSGNHCDGASLKAWVTDDLNQNNNMAASK